MAVISSRSLFPKREPIYELLSRVKPGLFLDVGASNGHKAEIMLANSPDSEVIAIEPFPTNAELLRNRFKNDSRVQVIQKAVSDIPGTAHFSVSSVVEEDTKNFEKGYSSLGFIVDAPIEGAAFNIDVETVGIDEVLDGRCAVFMKVDVQGGELGVLKSARSSLDNNKIQMIFLEFSGSLSELNFLAEREYVIFDTQYVVIPQGPGDLSNWVLMQDGKPAMLSNGLKAYHVWPKTMPTSLEAYVDFLKEERQRAGIIWTDLMCFTRDVLPAVFGDSGSIK